MSKINSNFKNFFFFNLDKLFHFLKPGIPPLLRKCVCVSVRVCVWERARKYVCCNNYQESLIEQILHFDFFRPLGLLRNLGHQNISEILNLKATFILRRNWGGGEGGFSGRQLTRQCQSNLMKDKKKLWWTIKLNIFFAISNNKL